MTGQPLKKERKTRKVTTSKSELDSNQNKITSLTSFKHFGDSIEYNNDKSFYLTL